MKHFSQHIPDLVRKVSPVSLVRMVVQFWDEERLVGAILL